MVYRYVLALAAAAAMWGTLGLSAQSGGGKTLTAQDFMDIQQLYARYNWTLDSGDVEGYANTFTPDGVFNNNVGREAIVKFATGFKSSMGTRVKHWNTNLMITPTADGAAGQVYLVLVDFSTKPVSIATSASYTDEMVKTPQGWRFKKRMTKGDQAPAPVAKP
jgi:hypothetical protein